MNEFAMHDAVLSGDLDSVRQLIEAGVSVDSFDEEGYTPLQLAAGYGLYEVAALLINSKCDLEIKDDCGRTPMMVCAREEMKEFVDLLLHRGAQVNCVDGKGWTPLHYASNANTGTQVVRLILEIGKADVNAVNHRGETPLMLAAAHGNGEVAAFLIQAGADVNRSDEQKRTALHTAVIYGSQYTRYRVVQILLEKEGLHLSPQDWHGDTPLHFACQMSCQLTIRKFLDAGADTNLKNNRGETPFRFLIRVKYLVINDLVIDNIRLFVEKGAFLEKRDYECISQEPFLKENILKDVEFCKQSIVNKFNRQSLPALNSIAHLAGRLPKVDKFKLDDQKAKEVRELVKGEIERNTFCDVVKVHPISLGALCVLSLITCQSGRKRAGSPDFGPSPFKKIS